MEENENILVVELKSINVPDIRESHFHSDKWVKYGENDEYVDWILDMYNNSPTHKAIVNTKANMIAGKGLNIEDEDFRFNAKEKPKRTLWKIARDYALFNGFAIQVIWNEGDNIAEMHHMDFSRLRAVPKPETAIADTYLFSRNFKKTNTKQYKPKPISVYNPEAQGKQKRQVFYFYEEEPGVDYYPVPTYNAGFMDIEFEHLFSMFKANTMENGMFPTVHVKAPGEPDKTKKQKFYEKLKRTFSGSRNAGKFIVTWADDPDNHVEINPIELNGNSDLYTAWKEDCRQGIISAHQLTSPVLAGLSGSGNLAGNANEINTAFEQFQNIFVDQKQENLLDTLKDLFEHWHTAIDTDELMIMSKRPVTEIPEIAFDVAEDEQIRKWMTDLFGVEFDQDIIDKVLQERENRTNALPPNPFNAGPAPEPPAAVGVS